MQLNKIKFFFLYVISLGYKTVLRSKFVSGIKLYKFCFDCLDD